MENDWKLCENEKPPKKEDFSHSEAVLVWYEATEKERAGYGISYYHYSPPNQKPLWVDFNSMRTPKFWQKITSPAF